MSECQRAPVPSAGPENRESRCYAEVRKEIRNGDVLLFRPQGLVWRIVAQGGRSRYCHAALAAWWGSRLMCVEMTRSGGRAQKLSNIVKKRPVETIDVFSLATKHRYYRRKAVDAMIDITGVEYGWWNLFRAALAHTAVVRCFVSPEFEDAQASRWPPFCSQAVSMAMRAGGVDPVPNLADRLTEPGDLARSSDLEYRFTLV